MNTSNTKHNQNPLNNSMEEREIINPKNQIHQKNQDHKNYIQITNGFKMYKSGSQGIVALDKLTITIEPGITLISGPSGSGKTTLLNAICGLESLEAGTITFNEHTISNMSDQELLIFRRNHIGFVFQFFNLIPSFTGYENIIFPLELNNDLILEKKQRIDEIIEMLEIKDLMDRFPTEMSGGEQQRVAIASGLAYDPEILLCDEPTGNLPLLLKQKIAEILQALSKKYPSKIIVIVSHDPIFDKYADYKYIIEAGKIYSKNGEILDN